MHRTWLVLVGFIALALAIFVTRQVYRASQFETASARPVDVVVAANDIRVGATIVDKDVKVLKFPAINLPPGCFNTKWQVIGHGVVLPIAKGEFILPSKLAATADSTLPGLIPPGMRAVSVRVNDAVAVAGFIVPGTRVDVLLTGTAGRDDEQQSTTVLENVAVLAAGQRLERNSAGEPQNVAVVTLLVSPQDAEKLTLASSKGSIQLVLHNRLDRGQPMQRDTPLKPIPRLEPIPPEVPLSPRLTRRA